jgi:hypothetical protein
MSQRQFSHLRRGETHDRHCRFHSKFNDDVRAQPPRPFVSAHQAAAVTCMIIGQALLSIHSLRTPSKARTVVNNRVLERRLQKTK